MGGFMDIFSTSNEQAVNTGPWWAQQPFIRKGFSEAEKLYDQGGPQYFPDQTLADRNPLINQSEDAMMGYAGGDAFRNMLDTGYDTTANNLGGGYFGYSNVFDDPNVGAAYKTAISGDPNPYTKSAMDAADRDTLESFNRYVRPAITDNMVLSGQHGGSTRSDLMNRRAVDDLTENMSRNRSNAYMGAYENAQNRALSGLGLAEGTRAGIGREDLSRYGTAMGYVPQQFNTEMSALGVPGQVGADRQQYNQAEIDDARLRWEYEQNLPYANLAQFQNSVGGNYGTSGTTLNTSTPSPWSVGKELFNTGVGIASMFAGLPGGGAAGGAGGLQGLSLAPRGPSGGFFG